MPDDLAYRLVLIDEHKTVGSSDDAGLRVTFLGATYIKPQTADGDEMVYLIMQRVGAKI